MKYYPMKHFHIILYLSYEIFKKRDVTFLYTTVLFLMLVIINGAFIWTEGSIIYKNIL